MKFHCKNCDRAFVYAAKKTEFSYNTEEDMVQIGKVIVSAILESQTETHVCPFCGEKDFDEVEQPRVEAAVQVEWAEVNKFLAEGYVIVDRYAKNATLFKLEKPVESLHDYAEEAIKTADRSLVSDEDGMEVEK